MKNIILSIMLSAAATAGLDSTVFSNPSNMDIDTHISLQAVIIAVITALSNVLIHKIERRRRKRKEKLEAFNQRTNSDVPASSYKKIQDLKKT